jgi:hypothetical protein
VAQCILDRPVVHRVLAQHRKPRARSAQQRQQARIDAFGG